MTHPLHVTNHHSVAKSPRLRGGRDRNSRTRRGFALIDVIVGAVILGIGIAVVISLSSRSLATQADGEHRMVAAWLADELLNMVIVEGPDRFGVLNDLRGTYEPPFEGYRYEVMIEERAEYEAYRVTAQIGWEPVRGSGVLEVQTYIARRLGDPDQPREPNEWVDRDQRHHERMYGPDVFEQVEQEQAAER